ncbi:MAG: hypothetical protein V4739_14190 [Pseudomonadota bacterium]
MKTSVVSIPLARRAGFWLASAVLATSLAACGGGGDGEYEDEGPPPQITLGSSITAGQRGQPLQLGADVSAANGIDFVNFYRIDFGTPVLIAQVTSPPAAIETAVPVNAGNTVRYFAEVCDLIGFCTDSNIVVISVFP